MNHQIKRSLAQECLNQEMYVSKDWQIYHTYQDILVSKHHQYLIDVIRGADRNIVAAAIIRNSDRQLMTYVKPEHRRKGYGTQVIQKLLAQEDIDPDTLRAAKGEPASEAFYSKNKIWFTEDGGLFMTSEEYRYLTTFGFNRRTMSQVMKNKNRKARGEPVNVRILTNSSEPHYFKRVDLNTYIGYHIEGGETFELAGSVPLSMDMLRNDRPLFLCNDPGVWMNTDDQCVYEITFKLPKALVFHSNSDYHSLFRYVAASNTWQYTKRMTQVLRSNFEGFILETENDRGSESECFLIRPKDCVLSIRRIAAVDR